MYLGQNISYLVSSHGVSRKDLADKLNVSYNHTGKYLRGENEHGIEGLLVLGQLFNVTIEDLAILDLSKNEGRSFGGGVEAESTPDDQLILLNKILLRRVQELER